MKTLRLPRSPKVLAGIGILGFFLLLTIIGPYIAPYNPSETLFIPNMGPSGPTGSARPASDRTSFLNFSWEHAPPWSLPYWRVSSQRSWPWSSA